MHNFRKKPEGTDPSHARTAFMHWLDALLRHDEGRALLRAALQASEPPVIDLAANRPPRPSRPRRGSSRKPGSR